jgi:hypothetical protein
MARGVLTGCLAGLAVIAAAAAAWAGTHIDEGRGFSFEVPADWEPMPADQLDAINARVESAYRGSRLVAGYVRAIKDRANAPYFVVQVTETDLAGLDYDEVAEKLDIDATRESADRAQVTSANTIARMRMRRAALDRDNNRFVFQGPAGAPPMANLVRSSVGFLANDGVVTLHCYAKAKDAESVRPVFDAVIASFQFEDGFEYHAGTASMTFFGVVWRVALIGGAIALLVWLVKEWLPGMTARSTRGRRRDPHRLFAQRYRLR